VIAWKRGEIMTEARKGAETFFIGKGKLGCLLIHGGTGTPAVMKPMGEYLATEGISVLGIRLKGFGTSEQEWLETKHADWINSAEEGVEELRRHCEKAFLAGLSMGGSLALYLAAKHRKDICGVISICAPAGPQFLDNFRKRFAPLSRENLPQANFTATDIKDKNVTAGGYEHHYPILNLEWAKVVEKSNRGIKSIICPALIIQAKNDHVIDPQTAEWIYQNIGSKKKEIVWLENSYHMATIDVDKSTVFSRSADFIGKHSN